MAVRPGEADRTTSATDSPPTAAVRPGASRVYRGELTAAGCALALLGLMFLTKWYGVAGVPDPSAARPAVSTAENAWNGLTTVRWVMLATIVAAIGSVILHASQRNHGTRTDTSRVLLVLGSATAALLVYRVLIHLPEPGRVLDQKLGAVLGMLCALGLVLGALESVIEQSQPVGSPRHRRRSVNR
ncbi:MAG: hypothetical protein M3016_07100 [Actinomycetota bacterium]|nr:hypothetical protein [Actinomycetota bacterium]